MRRSSVLAGGLVAMSLCLASSTSVAGPPRNPSLASCERGVAKAPERRESWGCFYDHARASSDWAQTADALRAELAPLELAGLEPRSRGYAHLALANVVAELDNDAGIALYETAATELEQGDDSLALTLTLLNLAHRHRVGGQPAASSEDLRRAERAAARFGDPRWIATVKVERVRHTLRVGGDLGAALQLLNETEALLFPEGDYQAQVNWFTAAFGVHRQLGQLTEARALVDRHITLLADAGDQFAEASIRYNRLLIMIAQALAEGEVEPSDELLAQVESAVAIGEAGGNRWATLSLRMLQVELLLTRGAKREAEALARRCVGEAEVLGDPRLNIEAALQLVQVILYGDSPLDAARSAEAAALLDAALARAVASEDAISELGIRSSIADSRWREGPGPEAIAASEALLAAVEAVRALQSDPTSQAEVQAHQADAYEHYIDHLLRAAAKADDEGERARFIGEAFAVGERFRARVLRETIGGREDPELNRAFELVQRELSGDELGLDQREAALAQLDELERRELEALAQLDSKLAAPALAPREPGARLAEVQAGLDEREALLVFQLSTPDDWDPTRHKRAWVLVITRTRADAIELASPDQIRARVAMFGPAIERRDQAVDAAAGKLGALLLGEALATLPESIDQLSLVLDGPLHQLPFASLGLAGQRVIDRYTVSVVPSASTLMQWRSQREAGSSPSSVLSSVLALADPPALEPALWDVARERGAERPGLLSPLPHARREAELAAHRPDDTRWLGAEANESALLELDLDRYAVVHFATHALIDERHPGRSAIVLARGEGDGLLQPREIAGLELEGKLVVLSACSSARGRVITGEGVMGLAHALFGAGAHTVVGSLWPLRDDEALALFERFYVHLDQGQDVASSLRSAQRDRAAAGAPLAAWAGVVVLGDGNLVPFPAGRADPQLASPRVDEAPSGSPAWGLASLIVLACGLVLVRATRSGQ